MTTKKSEAEARLSTPATSSQYHSEQRTGLELNSDDTPLNLKNKPKSIGHYILGKSIGEGTFGKVKLGTHILTGEKVAIKILEKARINDVADVERVAREIHILKLIRHPNIIQLYEIIETPKQLYLVMEYAKGGELFDYIVARTKIQEREASRFFQQIIAGIEYIHKLNIVHRDLKPENLLFDENKNVKIVDFGLSNTYKDKELLKTACGSPCYAAPEMIAGKKYYGLTVDIWSCGVILFAMICGYLPFEDANTSVLYKKILGGDYKIPEFISEAGRDLLKKILNTDPNTRYTIEDIRRHPWMTQTKLPKEPTGIIVGLHKMPIDYSILTQMERYSFTLDHIEKCLDANKHNHVTTTYYLLLKKHIQSGGKSKADYNSENFDVEFIKQSSQKRRPRSVMRNNYMGSHHEGSYSEDKERYRDASFNEDNLAETLKQQIKMKKQLGSTGGSSSRERELSLNLMNYNNISINGSLSKQSGKEASRKPVHSRDSSTDKQRFSRLSEEKASKENYDSNVLRERVNGNNHKPALRGLSSQQQAPPKKPSTAGGSRGSEKRDIQKDLREKLRIMLQGRQNPNDSFAHPTSNSNDASRSYKRPKDLSLTSNELFDDAIRSDIKSIGNTTSQHPCLLEDFSSEKTSKKTSSIYSTPKDDFNKSRSKAKRGHSNDHANFNDSLNMSGFNDSGKYKNPALHKREASPVANGHLYRGASSSGRRPSSQAKQQAPTAKSKQLLIPKEPYEPRPQLLPNNRGTGHRSKQVTANETHKRMMSTEQREKKLPGAPMIHKVRASSQQARRTKAHNKSEVYDVPPDTSMNASFAMNASYQGSQHPRHARNNSYDKKPLRMRSSSRGNDLNSTMYQTDGRSKPQQKPELAPVTFYNSAMKDYMRKKGYNK